MEVAKKIYKFQSLMNLYLIYLVLFIYKAHSNCIYEKTYLAYLLQAILQIITRYKPLLSVTKPYETSFFWIFYSRVPDPGAVNAFHAYTSVKKKYK